MKKDITQLSDELFELYRQTRSIRDEIWELIKKNRTKMKPMSYKVLRRKWNADQKKNGTFEEVARELGITRERCRRLADEGVNVINEIVNTQNQELSELKSTLEEKK